MLVTPRHGYRGGRRRSQPVFFSTSPRPFGCAAHQGYLHSAAPLQDPAPSVDLCRDCRADLSPLPPHDSPPTLSVTLSTTSVKVLCPFLSQLSSALPFLTTFDHADRIQVHVVFAHDRVLTDVHPAPSSVRTVVPNRSSLSKGDLSHQGRQGSSPGTPCSHGPQGVFVGVAFPHLIALLVRSRCFRGPYVRRCGALELLIPRFLFFFRFLFLVMPNSYLETSILITALDK